MDDLDPVVSNGDHYTVLFENDRVRVLEYRDRPGDRTTPHRHPDSVIVTLASFRRRLHRDGEHHDADLSAGRAGWVPAQVHSGENIGETESHAIFVELKDGPPGERVRDG